MPEQTFIHHRRAFVIEADGWLDEESGAAAIIDLQSWAMSLDQDQTFQLHRALQQEREALVHEIRYDRDATPLPTMRTAQRQAVKAGLAGKSPAGSPPTVVIEAYQERSSPANQSA